MSTEKGLTGPSDTVRLGDEEATSAGHFRRPSSACGRSSTTSRGSTDASARYRVTIFGSARTDPDHWDYAAVRDLAEELTRLGCDIVTGGGPGLMQAANEGARLAGATSTRVPSASASTCPSSKT